MAEGTALTEIAHQTTPSFFADALPRPGAAAVLAVGVLDALGAVFASPT